MGYAQFENGTINFEEGNKYQVSVSQLALRFVYQAGVIPLPKASSIERQKENLDIFGFEISQDDFNLLSCVPNTLWSGEHPDLVIPKKKSNFNQ